MLSFAYFKSYRMPLCVTRCGNLYGGGDLNFNRIIPETIRSVIRGGRPIVRSDGSYVRDYFYVQDAASAYMFLAERMAEDESLYGEAFNFSTETPVAVIELVRKIVALMGREDLEPIVRNEASNEIPFQYLSAQKAREKLGWKPSFTLEEGLKATLAWYEEFFRREGL